MYALWIDRQYLTYWNFDWLAGCCVLMVLAHISIFVLDIVYV